MTTATEAAELEAFERRFEAACSIIIEQAKRLKPLLAISDDQAARELGRIAGREMAMAGATEDEARHYSKMILLMVLQEPQS